MLKYKISFVAFFCVLSWVKEVQAYEVRRYDVEQVEASGDAEEKIEAPSDATDLSQFKVTVDQALSNFLAYPFFPQVESAMKKLSSDIQEHIGYLNYFLNKKIKQKKDGLLGKIEVIQKLLQQRSDVLERYQGLRQKMIARVSEYKDNYIIDLEEFNKYFKASPVVKRKIVYKAFMLGPNSFFYTFFKLYPSESLEDFFEKTHSSHVLQDNAFLNEAVLELQEIYENIKKINLDIKDTYEGMKKENTKLSLDIKKIRKRIFKSEMLLLRFSSVSSSALRWLGVKSKPAQKDHPLLSSVPKACPYIQINNPS